MRLLNTRTGDFCWVNDPSGFKFAILSHVWSTDGEQTYQDLLKLQDDVRSERETSPDVVPFDAVLLRASSKVREACAYALANGFDFIWIDSCCIDKTSSAELSEAINSMYLWYRLSTVCYAFLADVTAGSAGEERGEEDPRLPNSGFRCSRWYTRGWTLQELIAPHTVVFLSKEWRSLGTKEELAEVIEEVTGIDVGVLTHAVPLSSVTVARRMRWAAKRVTTRKEDEAYSLVGIFGVNMPAIYGEGEQAFLRLQEEIMKQVPDQSIFVWDPHLVSMESEERDDRRHTLLAPSPAAFAHSGGVQTISWEELVHKLGATGPPPSYIPTSHGLRTALPLLPIGPFFQLAFLACKDEDGHLLALVLKNIPGTDVRSVGTLGWERVRLRYRNLLYTLPWGRYPGILGSIDAEEAEERLTRVVRVVRYPTKVAVVGVGIAHQPSLLAALHIPSSQTDRIIQGLEVQDDLFPMTTRGQGVHVSVASVLFDILVVASMFCILVLGFFLVGFLTYMLAYVLKQFRT